MHGSRSDVPGGIVRRIRRLALDRSVRVKVLGSVLVAVLVAVVVGVTSLARLADLQHRVDQVRARGLVPVQQLAAVRRGVLQTRIDALADAMPGHASTEHAAFLADLTTVNAAFGTFVAYTDEPGVPPVADFQAAWKTYTDVVGGPLLARARALDWAGYTALRNAQVKPVAAAYNGALTAMENHATDVAAAQVAAARSNVRTARDIVLAVLVVGSVLALLLAWLVARSVVGAVHRVLRVVEGLARGDLTRSAAVDSADEVGQMAAALDQATARLRTLVGAVAGNADSLAGSSEELTMVAATIASAAEETAAQSGVVAAAADDVDANVQTLATGSDQMTTSIQEIARNASEAARVATHAVQVATDATATVARLGDSSNQISHVLKLITAIAEQTNLLALNATIEAARAGDAGKGFAVVASEVKDLAQETAKATDEIARRVQAIQTDTGAAVVSIQEITEVIDRINGYQTTIASAVEEQTSTSNEMSRNVANAATSVSEIAGNISSVAAAAEITTTGVSQTRQAVDELARMATDLRGLISQLTY